METVSIPDHILAPWTAKGNKKSTRKTLQPSYQSPHQHPHTHKSPPVGKEVPVLSEISFPHKSTQKFLLCECVEETISLWGCSENPLPMQMYRKFPSSVRVYRKFPLHHSIKLVFLGVCERYPSPWGCRGNLLSMGMYKTNTFWWTTKIILHVYLWYLWSVKKFLWSLQWKGRHHWQDTLEHTGF